MHIVCPALFDLHQALPVADVSGDMSDGIGDNAGEGLHVTELPVMGANPIFDGKLECRIAVV